MNADYRRTVEALDALLREVPEPLTAVKLAPDKWSLREILGHLVDSAANNHQRFVRLQEPGPLRFPGYEAERWVHTQRYNLFPWAPLVALWRAYNQLILHVLEQARPERLQNVWQTADGPLTLEWLARDYYRHLGDHAEHFRLRLAELQGKPA